MQVTIHAAHLKAALQFAADRDVRYYLNGVFVEARPHETRIVGCDGNIIGVLRDVVEEGEQDDMPDVIIPTATAKMALTTKSAALSLTHDDGKWALAGISFVPVDGVFPDYRRVIPGNHSGAAAQFSVDLLARILKAGRALGIRSQPIIRHNGDDGAQVQFYGCDEFVGVIMPLSAFNEKYPDPGLVQWGAERSAPPL